MVMFFRLLMCWLVLVSAGCITTKKEEQLRSDLFQVLTRLLALEKKLGDSSSIGGKANSKRIASASASLQKMERDISMLRGEIDTLKRGFETGDVPGQASDTPSVGKTLREILVRLDNLDSSIAGLQEEMENGDTKSSATGSGPSQRKAMTSIAQVQKAFDKKRYRHVVDDAKPLMLKAKGKKRQELHYLYAESLYKLGKLRDAAIQFSDFVDSKPEEKYLPHSKLRVGDCFRHLGDFAAAKLYYEEVVLVYSKAPEAKLAKERLETVDSKLR